MSVINCINYSDHEEGPLSQTRTVGYSRYSIQLPISSYILPPAGAVMLRSQEK